jgi:hypothetical protein
MYNATCCLNPKAYETLAQHGICIITDFFTEYAQAKTAAGKAKTPVPPLFRCTKKQASYITLKKTPTVPVFNGVILASKSSIYKTDMLPPNANTEPPPSGARMMLENCGENQAAMEEYYDQMDIIIKKMFKDSEYHKNKPDNWLKKMQNLMGGHEYQHAHADQARPHSYRDEKTFPFVVTHGFGMNEFQLWLLPMNAKHGILHTFNMDALVLMRGDFVHAGGICKLPRCHMEFFPKPNAGFVQGHQHHFWLDPDYKCDIALKNEEDNEVEASFLWQGPHFPFAYPVASYAPNSMGKMRTVLNYPADVTELLVSVEKTIERAAVWRKITAQHF